MGSPLRPPPTTRRLSLRVESCRSSKAGVLPPPPSSAVARIAGETRAVLHRAKFRTRTGRGAGVARSRSQPRALFSNAACLVLPPFTPCCTLIAIALPVRICLGCVTRETVRLLWTLTRSTHARELTPPYPVPAARGPLSTPPSPHCASNWSTARRSSSSQTLRHPRRVSEPPPPAPNTTTRSRHLYSRALERLPMPGHEPMQLLRLSGSFPPPPRLEPA